MSMNEEFDELARRKLQERRLEYQEADWQQARVLLDARRGSRRLGWWAGGAGLLLLVAWFLLPGSATEKSAPNTVVSAPAERHLKPTPSPGLQAVNRTADQQPVRHAPSGAAALPMEDTVAYTALPHATENTKAASAAPGRLGSTATAPRMLEAAAPAAEPQIIQAAEQMPATAGRPANLESGASMMIPPGAPEQLAEPKADPAPVPVADAAPVEPALQSRMKTAPDKETAPEAHSTASSFATATQGNEGPPAPIDQPAVPSGPATSAAQDTLAGDSTASAPPIAPSDTLLAAAPAPPAPPIVPERAPWEITVLGGRFTTSSRYTGGNSAEWSRALGNASSTGFGAELMHVGRNISLGFGLHYGTYAERLRLDAVDITSITHQQYWYLAGIDTTVLVITDTLAGTPPTYTGQSMDTTIYVLAQGTDTVLHHQHIRDARDAVNRVSYVEVPLLADVHIVQGRWNIGLRGGPTIGLLSARRGAVPNSAGDGYTPLQEVAFREVVFGYTARAYLRYRFNAAWSVGLEPALRGQLFNSLGGDGLSRRATAKGIQLSLTYRLR